MIPLFRYAKIKDHYCIYYSGPSPDYLSQLIAVKSQIESELTGIYIHIVCRDDLLYLGENEERIYPQSKLEELKLKFGYIRELKYDLVNNPVEALLMESELLQSLQTFSNRKQK